MSFTTENLIKGRIAETVFEQMFSKDGGCKVIPFGFEWTVPELARTRKSDDENEALKTMRSAPDFAVIGPDGKISLVEVKYRKRIDNDYVIKDAEEQNKRWHPSSLFVATLDGFFMGECSDIMKDGFIPKLNTNVIGTDVQATYQKLIQEFEQ